MTGLEAIFAGPRISHHLNDFTEQGLDSWDTVLDIVESDLDDLGVKLGYRRKLQRKMTRLRGLPSGKAITSLTRHTLSDDPQVDGSQDHEIKIKDFPEVQVGNRMNWQPIKGGDNKELQSNLTSDEVEKLVSEIVIDNEEDRVDIDSTIKVDVD